MADAPAAPSDQYSAGIDRYRTTAKWLISTFAALGAVLIAGVQITGIGNLSGHRLHMAILGLAIGLLGVAVAIAAATSVLTPEVAVPEQLVSQRRFEPLRKYVRKYPAPLLHDKASNLAALVKAVNDAVVDEADKYKSYVSRKAGDAGYAAAETEFTDASNTRQSLQATIDHLQGLGLLMVVRRRFVVAICVMFPAALVAAGGAVLFTYWANPPKPAAPPTTAQAAIIDRHVVRVALTPAGRAVIQPPVGTRCDISRLRALILAGSATKPEIVTLPGRLCRSAQLTLSPTIGETYN